ncbi:guanine nucleotide-binding protein subunit beta-like protein 1 isoform X2 [Mirounga angustirostris]|uniref:guanine nucleotide-binding protein subunit beta-like protein 1 isoform X2 n=1 Tax=Mirounga angustirostris TaxID=9716 RepID=UPI0023E4286E|nr:guanine nucleotide-binding protein subunit beta-like protein 1 isoform X1 [Mirounga angustirostris]XP_054366362.1 guanine nucleotide-binding protein subunit beta-like protein 1 isoform X1 [Mirounga angustirostris]XP_054366363.1 guanine nucleotide-binding protein subunit beta-like protein 1 isoform X1 [Mirounga angustirostris]
MGAVPVAVTTPAVCSSNSTSRNTLPEQQWAKENSPGSVESPTLSTLACSTDPGPVGPTSSQPGEVTATSVPVLSGSANPPAQKPDPVPPGGPEPQKTEEEVSKTEVTAPPPSMAASPLPPPDPQFVLRGTQSAVHALHFFGGAQGQGRPLLLSGSLSGLVHIWSLQTRRAVATLDGHGGQCVTWLQTLPQGHRLLSQGRDLKLRLWDLAEGRNAIVDSVPLESMGFCRSSVLAGGQERWMLAMPGRGNDEVQILEMPSKTSVCTLKPEADAKPGMPMCLELWQADSSARPLLLAGYEDGSVALWDVSERKVCSRVACHTEPVMGFDFDSQKARGVSGSAEKALAVWSLDEQQALQVCRTHELTNPGIADVKIRPDRKILVTAGWDHRVRVFHWWTMKPLAVLSFHSATVHCVAFATDGLLAAGSGDQRISIWSLYPIRSNASTPSLGHAEGREVGTQTLA